MAMAYGSEDMTGRSARRSASRARATVAAAARAKLKAFRTARRHTWLVRSLKIAFPVLVVLAFAGYAALLRGTVSVGAGKLSVGKVEVTADDLKMKNLTYFGVTKDGGKYDVRAKEATVDFAQTGPVRLDFIEGDLTQQNGVVTRLKSRRGLLDNKKGEMELLDGVEIDATNGLAARLRSAKVFNKEHRIVSQQPVVAAMPAGQIEANAMDLEAKARKGVFTGNVRVRLTQSETGSKANLGLAREAKGPVDVRSQKLDMDDTAKVANFTGGVTAQQGETTLQASALKVSYEGKTTVPDGGLATVAATDGDAARVTRLVAAGNVTIVAGADRKITSDAVDLDVRNDSALFTGGRVEIQQGANRLAGRRLSIDRRSGRSRLDAPAEGRTPAGRIQTMFVPQNADKQTKPSARAEDAGGAIATFKTDPNAPMDIEADSLDVSDPAKQAVFRGRVVAKQADFTIHAAELVANFSGETGLMNTGGTPAQKGSAQITKVDAKNKVQITSKDGQEATGEWATFDTKANTVVLGGGVTVKRGRDVVIGPRLRIDTVTGVAQFENDPGVGAVGTALPAQASPRSAAGPGGLPAVSAPTPAPAVPSNCAPGRQCITMYPDDAKKAAKEKVKTIPKVAPATPSWSPSQVYRAP